MQTKSRIDIIATFLFLCIATLGISCVYSATSEFGVFSLFEGRSGKQMMFLGIAIFIGLVFFLLNSNFFELFSWPIYGAIMLLLVAVLFVGSDINGARSWIKIGSFSLQPSEFAKYGTAFAVSALLSTIGFSFSKKADIVKLLLVILLPMGLIILQGDTGSALVFASFILVFYREGLSPLLLVLGISIIAIFVLTLMYGSLIFSVAMIVLLGVVFAFTYTNKKILLPSIIIAVLTILLSLSVQFLFDNVLQEHQKKRIQVTLNLIEDNQGAGYNVNQSKIAIGSGGWSGKGFLNGSHTKGNFIPEQTTDFIFCTIGEEGGWLLSSGTILLFVLLILRLYHMANRAKKKYKRVFIFSLASILFFHLTINVGMTIGIMPVIGIPLPFISYGGSSILSFTVFMFTALKMDASRDEDLTSEY
ncbi:MAG: rod shape-determining protein RodA [Bacteroidia bacterium]|jgi:rod shape determining protein RodA